MATSNQILNDRTNNGPAGAGMGAGVGSGSGTGAVGASASTQLASAVSKRRIDSALPANRSVLNISNRSSMTKSQFSLGSNKTDLALQKRNDEEDERTNNSQNEDSLEYFIKFPSSKFYNEQTSETDIYISCNDPNVPIVLLLGWAGCQHRYLMKYSKIYEDRGLITVRYTAPVDTLFWKRSAMIPIGEKILKLIYDMNLDTHPVIFHIFSNGGAYLYQHIGLAIRRHNTPLKIKGIIFDSAPGERRILGLYRAVTAIYGKERRKCNCITAVFITVTLSMMWFVEEALAAFKSLFMNTQSPKQTNPFNDLKNEPNKYPQLFLYSKGDAVIPYQDVEKFIKIRQNQGVSVSSVCFDDAEHVKIYTKYPKQYIHCVCTFINKCLSLPFIGDAGDAAFSSTNNSTADLIEPHSTKYD